MEDLYPTNREDGNLVDNESLAWLWNLKSSETFEGENTSEISERGRGTSTSPLTATSSTTLERNDETDPQSTGESLNQINDDPDNREPPSEIENVYLVSNETL